MPDWKTLIRERVAPLRLEATGEAALIDEVTQHLEDLYQELRSGGATEREAYAKAVAELDDLYPLAEGLRRSDRMPKDLPAANFFSGFWRDFRYALRTIRKGPVFALFVILTLALGIGANTTVFTLINTLILNPLPVADPSGLAAVLVVQTRRDSHARAPLPVSYADLKDYQDRNQVFRTLSGYTSPRVLTWQGNGPAQRIFGELVAANYFPTLGLKPARGRFFLPDEDRVAGGHAVAVMNYASWQTLFGGADDIIGKALRINNVVFIVVGVAPPGFIGVNGIFGPDVWIPATMAERLLPNEMRNALGDRGKAVFTGIGRLKPEISREQAQANMVTLAAALARENPATDEGHSVTIVPIREVFFGNTGSTLQPMLFASAALLAVVGIVLLIACSNVANLLLARSAARQNEMAVRLAMGASRARLVRQLLTESVLLGLLSGILGIGIGYAGMRLLLGTLPGSANFVTPKLDATVFGFAFAISLATGFLFGIIPAFKASRASVAETLKEEARTTGRSRRRVTVAGALLVGQVAFSFLLLMTAALFLRSIAQAYKIDPGFQTEHLAVFLTNPGQAGYGKARTKEFYKDVRERVARLPGMVSAAWASNLPLWSRAVNGLQIEGRQARSQADKITTIVNTVGVDYFETAGVALERGRAFTAADQEDSLPVAIVNEKAAHDYWPDSGAIGKRIQLPGETYMRQIVGVARTTNYSSWAEPPQLCVYVPMEQSYSDGMTLYVRSQGDPAPMINPVLGEIRAAGAEVLVSSPRTGRVIVDNGLFQAKVGVMLLAVFGLLALGLASIGLYGILAYSVNQRKREIGLRMALGASQRSVLGLILKQGMSLVLLGVAIGFAAAQLAARFLGRLLYGISGSDPVSVAGAALMLLAIALVACYLPARRASRVDPVVALREG